MSLDTQIRTQLTSAVADTTVPPGLARAAVAGGRRRRRIRVGGGLVLATAAVVAGSLVLPGSPVSLDDQVAGRQAGMADPVAFAWAGALPEGTAPALPYFAYGRLWSGEESITLPAAVNPTVGPWAVDGGWIVMVGKSESDLGWALLSPDGGLRALPPETYADGLGMARFEVSADGRSAVTGKWLVDLGTMTATVLPHAPAQDEADGYYTDVRPHGFTDQGLVYEAAPYVEGIGTTYVLRPDGTTARIDLPADTHVPDGSPGDVAVRYAYSADDSDTCVTSHRLVDVRWVVDGTGCLGKSLGEALSISPDGRWLITDDLPRVWDLQRGEFANVDVPREVVTSRGDALVGGIVWETADTFLLPVPDRTSEGMAGPVDFDQMVDVVRCRLSTGACKLARSVENRVVVDQMASTDFRFATS